MSTASKSEAPEFIESVVDQVSRIVSQIAGIQLGKKQYSMVENRLRTRMVRMKISTFSQYLAYLKKHQEEESQALVSLLTTHHTYFFREFSHFEFLINSGLSQLIKTARDRGDKTIRIWSAACSRGHEVYTLGMFFYQHLSLMAPDVTFEIWGSDVDPESVQYAKNGVYRNEELAKSPAVYINGNVIPGKGSAQGFSKIKKHITDKCRFQVVNLFDPASFLDNKKFDLVFCRNVFIYFDQDQIKSITTSMLNHLDPNGYMVLGVSESLNGLGLPVDLLQASIFKHRGRGGQAGADTSTQGAALARTYDVLCVDDSGTILALLKKVLDEEHGFRVKATAKNGREALDKLALEKFDIVTLDLHMPEVDGIEFLKAGGAKDQPVVVVSAISRENQEVAQKAISLGATDYVEKPTVENLVSSGNEIRAKLKIALQGLGPNKAQAPSLNKRSTVPTERKPVIADKKVAAVEPSRRSETALAARPGKIRTMIVDDSATIRQVMHVILSQDPEFEIVAEAEKPSDVEGLIQKHKPDLITLDIHMPEMDGLTLLKKIHPAYRIPTVMISSISATEGPIVLQSLESGAVDYIEKPSMKELGVQAQMIRDRLKTAARAKMTKTPRHGTKVRSGGSLNLNSSLIVMGASTGGTEALRVVLESMPPQIPPVLIVQHIPPHFSKAFADRLNQILPFEVREAVDGDVVKSNQVLIAPGGTQMKFVASGQDWKVKITDDAPVNRHKPSVDYLFDSVAAAKLSSVVAVVLTGMGADGARGLKTLRDRGARTIAQDEETSVVFGMPREAIERGGAEKVLPLEKVAEGIYSFFSKQSERKAA